MKLLLPRALVLVVAHLTTAESSQQASMENGIMHSTAAYESFMKATRQDSCKSCGCAGCCPVIIRKCGPKRGSVIESGPGWTATVRITVDNGCTEYNPCGCCPKGRLCTINDIGYVSYVDWGDGSGSDYSYQTHLGPFQRIHQYANRTASYGVTVYFCSEPGCPAERCCDSYYRVIEVSERPGKVTADISRL